ncbi:MAG: RNA methyltransferase [Planctomycetes bacterium]|nr:RNA methyltransferase [Planctomycetota bacterium]
MRPPPPLRWTAAARARLADAAEHRGGPFVLEGRKLVLDALRAGRVRVRELWVAEGLGAAADALLDAAAAAGVPVGRVPDAAIERTSDTVTPQGVLALADDPAVPAETVLAAAAGPLVLLDGVQDPGNVGAILRTAAAFRFAGALVGAGSADPVGPKALRASAGAALAVPFARGPVDALLAAVAASRRPVWLLDGDGASIFSTRLPAAAPVLAVGSEGRGASEAVRRAAAARVAIPISPAVESLNAAVAFGVVAAHLVGGRVAPSAPAAPAAGPPGPPHRPSPPRGSDAPRTPDRGRTRPRRPAP